MSNDFLLLAIIIAGGLSVGIGYLWKNKGHSFWAGFFLSLLLSPLAAGIIGFVMPAKNKNQIQGFFNNQNRPPLEEIRRCPYCDFRVGIDDNFCRNCGQKLIRE